MISFIVAKARNNVIGSRNDLPWYLPADLKHFKRLTTGHTVVMGRKTFESIIARLGKPLPDRDTIVVTRDTHFTYPEVKIIHDVREISQLGDCFVIGGAELWQQTFDLADRLYVTDIHAEIDGDRYFPEIDPTKWYEISRESHKRDDKNPYDYDFVLYERASKVTK